MYGAILQPLTEYHIDMARELSNQVVRALRGKNHTRLSALDRYFHGYLGELAVREWLTEHSKKNVHRVLANGKSQPAEFTVWQKKTDLQMRLEVKTSSKPEHRYLMFPQAQPLDFDCVLSVRLDLPQSKAEIMGWLSRRDVAGLRVEPFDFGNGHTVNTRVCLYEKLYQPQRLLDQLVDA